MILRINLIAAWTAHITRTCGDDPTNIWGYRGGDKYYPHMRGWSCHECDDSLTCEILPAHAGMILWGVVDVSCHNYITRTCGDDPTISPLDPISMTYYPHMLGWSCKYIKERSKKIILPAHAGMIPSKAIWVSRTANITRTCGDDPPVFPIRASFNLILPAHAGMILSNFK